MPIIFLNGKVTKQSFLDECRDRKIDPRDALFVFPSNDKHHGGKNNLHSYKTGSGLAKLAGELYYYNVATLGVPTMRQGCCGSSIQLNTVDNEDKELVDNAIVDLFTALGYGKTIFIVVRDQIPSEEQIGLVRNDSSTENKGADSREDKVEAKLSPRKNPVRGKYFDLVFENGKEPSFFGGEVKNADATTKALGNYIMRSGLLLLEELAACRGTIAIEKNLDKLETTHLHLKKAYEFGVTNSKSDAEDEWFKRPVDSCCDCILAVLSCGFWKREPLQELRQPPRSKTLGLGGQAIGLASSRSDLSEALLGDEQRNKNDY